jgi:hypothetical protein
MEGRDGTLLDFCIFGMLIFSSPIENHHQQWPQQEGYRPDAPLPSLQPLGAN